MFATVKPKLITSLATTFKRFISIPNNIPYKGLIKLDGSKFLQISGQDASLFINGLTTIKVIPKHVKKNQTTISAADLNNENIVKSIDLSHEEISSSNWGILNESEEFDPEDMNELQMRLGIRRDGRYGLILRANGRIFSDVFIYPSPFMFNTNNNNNNNNPTYLIEILNKDQFKPIQMMLKLHKLRSKVDIKEVNLNSWFYYNDSTEGKKVYDVLIDKYFSNFKSKNSKTSQKLAYDFINDDILINSNVDKDALYGFAIDQRSDYFGIRILMDENSTIDKFLTINDNNIENLPSEAYITRRIEHGIVENSDFQKTAALPFESNVDWMRGINYEKGCYMGQELTIRTWSGNGTVRRVLPIIFDEPIENIDDAFTKLELRVVENENSNNSSSIDDKNGDQPVYNPFGSKDSTSKSVRSRKDIGKVGDVLVHNGLRGLARVEKRYFDWDSELSKKVKVVYNNKEYIATIDTSMWN